MSPASTSSSLPFGSFRNQTLGRPFAVCGGLDILNNPPGNNSKCWIKLFLLFLNVPLSWQEREVFSEAENEVRTKLQREAGPRHVFSPGAHPKSQWCRASLEWTCGVQVAGDSPGEHQSWES